MKQAVVTGASGGIGSAIARRLASDGLAVTVGYNSATDKAEALVAEMGGAPHTAAHLPITDSESLAAFAASSGPIDVLVNCAGVTRPVAHDDLDALDDELIDWIFQTNWRGPFACIRALRPALEQATDGAVVVNISSVSAVTGQGSNVAYCASKAALDSMTRSLARALGPSIRMVSVSPGWVLGEYASRMPAEIIDTQRNQTPLHRLATPEDVGAAVSAVVNDLPFTTGSVVPVDGGRPLGTT
ncbi:MAG: SDR family NAD(P)-dependent oxidoreductase [Acidimicrobiales bacterium]